MSLAANLQIEKVTPVAGVASGTHPDLGAQMVSGPVWDRAVAEFDGVVPEQLFAYTKSRWPSAGHEPVLFSAGGHVVGGALVLVQGLPLRLGAIAVCKWGPILKDAPAPDADALKRTMTDWLVGEYGVRRRMMVSVLARAGAEAINSDFRYLVASGFKPGTPAPFPDRYIVNLGLDMAAQRKSLAQKWRYHLNKSEKAGLHFERAGIEEMDAFDALYRAMTDRKNFADHSAYDTVPALLGLDASTLRPELFFVRHEGELVAGAIIFKAGDTAVYLFGATNDRALPLRAGYFLHWHIIAWLRENTHARWYDLGGTDGFQGLHQFKKGMVGEAGIIVPMPPAANYAAYRLPLVLGNGAFAARDIAGRVRRRFEALAAHKAQPDQANRARTTPDRA